LVPPARRISGAGTSNIHSTHDNETGRLAHQHIRRVVNRTGHNNAELMGYIDDLMRDAGCY